MKWSLSVVAIGVLSMLSTIPVQAAAGSDRQIRQQELQQVRRWQTELAYSFCNQDWTNALSVSRALMGSEVITAEERWWLYVLQQDMFNYTHGLAEFKGCEPQGMVAGVTGQSAEPLIATRQAALVNWNRGLATLGQNLSSRATNPMIDDETSIAFAESTAQPIALNTACNPYAVEERRVANGSVSNQWHYEIWQDSRHSFYVRYWMQNESCDRAGSTSHYDSQREAYREFRSQIGIPLAEE